MNTNQKARIFITGSADGLGHAAAKTLLGDGYHVVVHVRSQVRLTAVQDLVDQGAIATIGDLSDFAQTRDLANQVNKVGQMDAVIHNAGVYSGPQVLPVNVVAPYLLTALIHRPKRLIYLSSGMHTGGRTTPNGIDWTGRISTGSYSDSKLFVTTLAAAVARIWAVVLSNSVDPGWVPTKMGELMRQMTCGWEILLKSGLLLAMILKRLLAEGIGIINDALSRIPLSTIRSFKLSCSTKSLVQQALRWHD